MAGVARDKRREKARADVELITPHGAEITVPATRAEQLLARPPIRFVDNVERRYVRADSGEDIEVGTAVTGAQPPRKGDRQNTGGA